MSLSERDYKKLAQAIVDDYTDQGISLSDSVIKVADDHSMNVHETRRLIEQTNLKTHLTLFKEASDHKYVEFDVVEPDHVVHELFGRVEPSAGDCGPGEKVASAAATVDHYFDLPDEYGQEKAAQVEKVAAAREVPEVEKANDNPFRGDRGYYKYARVNKVASEMENAIREKHMDYADAIEKIAEDFRSIYSEDFEEFEKDAYALHGESAGNVIQKVCDALGREPSMEPTKLANHFVIDRPVHEKLASAVDIREDLLEHVHGYQWFKSKAKPLLHD